MLHLQRKKELPFENVQSLELVAGKGIVGDCHCLGGEKQVALIMQEAKNWIVGQESEGLCFSRYHENIVTQGLDYSLLKEGNILKTNHTSIEISSISKRCFSECKLAQKNQICQLKTSSKFAKVIISGNIQLGDRIYIDDNN